MSNIIKGSLWMAASLVSLIATAVAARELSANLSTFQILFFRSVVGLAVLALLSRALLPELRHMVSARLHIFRNTLHFAAQYLWTLGIALLPLAEVFALEFTTPAWVAVFAALLLKERLRPARLLAIAISFAGVLVILRPGAQMLNSASLLVLVSAMGFGLSAVIVKLLTRSCSAGVIVAWMVLVQLPIGAIASIFAWRPVAITDIPWILVYGLTALSAHYALAQALRLMDASVAMPIDFLRLPLIALVGYYAYAEPLTIWLALGSAMILGSNYVALRAEARRK